jgi:adenylyl- and sulfurtransferase ThiI
LALVLGVVLGLVEIVALALAHIGDAVGGVAAAILRSIRAVRSCSTRLVLRPAAVPLPAGVA